MAERRMKNYTTVENRRRKKKLRNERPQRIFRWLEIPLAVFWMQLVFQLSTIRGLNLSFIFFGTLFAVAYGLVLEFLVALIPNKKAYMIVKGIVIAALAILMLAIFFTVRKFNTLYDINTMLGGAGGAIGEFQDSIMRMVFSFDGISHIIYFMIPVVLYIVAARLFTRKFCEIIWWPERGVGIISAVVIFLISILMVRIIPSSYSAYKTEYSFTLAVEKFGIFTGLRLDAMRIGGGADTDFEIQEPVKKPVKEPSTEVDTEGTEGNEPIVYGDNVLDIPFASLDGNKNLKNLDAYVQSVAPSSKNEYTGKFKGKNLIFISAEAFSAQCINEKLTPTLYRMATKGFQFTDYYQPESAGTTGGEYNNVFGMLPTAGGKSFKNAADNFNYYTMGWQLNKLGYWGKAYHNNTYTFYGRDKTHNKLGYSEGYMGWGNGMEKVFEAAGAKKTWPESDLVMIEGTVNEYINQDHFNVYYMSVSGHSDYGWGDNYIAGKYKDLVKDLDYSEPVKVYLACNIELDRAMESLIKSLEEAGKADDTVIVISADHFPYGLDEGGDSKNMPYLAELYGEKITDDLVRDQNRLILWSGCLEKEDPVEISTPVSSIDVLPTLMNLFGIEFDSRLLAGRDVFSDREPLVFNVNYQWKTTYGKYAKGEFTPVNENQTYPDGMSEDEYVDYIKTTVKNKMKYMSGVLDYDYYAHVFNKEPRE